MACELYDLDGNLVSRVNLPARQPGNPARSVVWRGRLFVEGGGPDNLYETGQLAEVTRDDT
jgi:hypothetical protein